MNVINISYSIDWQKCNATNDVFLNTSNRRHATLAFIITPGLPPGSRSFHACAPQTARASRPCRVRGWFGFRCGRPRLGSRYAVPFWSRYLPQILSNSCTKTTCTQAIHLNTRVGPVCDRPITISPSPRSLIWAFSRCTRCAKSKIFSTVCHVVDVDKYLQRGDRRVRNIHNCGKVVGSNRGWICCGLRLVNELRRVHTTGSKLTRLPSIARKCVRTCLTETLWTHEEV